MTLDDFLEHTFSQLGKLEKPHVNPQPSTLDPRPSTLNPRQVLARRLYTGQFDHHCLTITI
jgi:hypothetical protein